MQHYHYRPLHHQILVCLAEHREHARFRGGNGVDDLEQRRKPTHRHTVDGKGSEIGRVHSPFARRAILFAAPSSVHYKHRWNPRIVDISCLYLQDVASRNIGWLYDIAKSTPSILTNCFSATRTTSSPRLRPKQTGRARQDTIPDLKHAQKWERAKHNPCGKPPGTMHSPMRSTKPRLTSDEGTPPSDIRTLTPSRESYGSAIQGRQRRLKYTRRRIYLGAVPL